MGRFIWRLGRPVAMRTWCGGGGGGEGHTRVFGRVRWGRGERTKNTRMQDNENWGTCTAWGAIRKLAGLCPIVCIVRDAGLFQSHMKLTHEMADLHWLPTLAGPTHTAHLQTAGTPGLGCRRTHIAHPVYKRTCMHLLLWLCHLNNTCRTCEALGA